MAQQGGFLSFTGHHGRTVWVRAAAVVVVREHDCRRDEGRVEDAAELVLAGTSGQAVVDQLDAGGRS